MTLLAVDVGGTTIKGDLVDGAGSVVRTETIDTPPPGSVVDAIRAFCASFGAVDAVGVVVPGSVDADAGVARYSANLGWRDLPLRDLLRDDLGVPVALDHDVRAAALAERELGVARGIDDCVVVVIGTGIASVAVSGGRVVRGATGSAGEVGHLVVRPGGEPCPCGQRGCLERYASAAAVARRHGSVSAVEVVARLDADPTAREVWSEAIAALADGLAAVTMLGDPDLIVLGGGLSGAGDALLVPTREALAKALTWRPAPRLALSELGARAGRLGAALLARRLLDA